MENDLLKFFVHFSSIPKRKGVSFDQSSKHEWEHLVSFIWIKGNTLKFLDFVGMFRIIIQDRI